ncbi:MAG: hypothetical protein H8D45_04225 [Bacteroidetes bacterium]|nr:hypothetical protein [Bacteroidota bacterium]
MKIQLVLLTIILFCSFSNNLFSQEISIEDSLYQNLDSLYLLKNDASIESEGLRYELTTQYNKALEYLLQYMNMTDHDLKEFRNLFERSEKSINMDELTEEEMLDTINEISIYEKYVLLPEFYERFLALKEKAGLSEE